MKFLSLKIISFALLLTILGSCQKELKYDTELSGKSFNLKLNFKAVVDASPLQFNTEYKNFFQEPYTVTAFKFYIYNINLINTDSNIVSNISKADYFLIDASNPASTTISVKPMSHRYNYISFAVGVDSARNVSGAQTGALDPTMGMFWTWNSGYIMAKLEGTSPLSNQPNNKFEYHIGGFKSGENVVENILLPFPSSQGTAFLPGTQGTITLNANISAWFHNPNDIRIKINPVCMTPGDLAKKIAENYSNMFTIAGIANN